MKYLETRFIFYSKEHCFHVAHVEFYKSYQHINNFFYYYNSKSIF